MEEALFSQKKREIESSQRISRNVTNLKIRILLQNLLQPFPTFIAENSILYLSVNGPHGKTDTGWIQIIFAAFALSNFVLFSNLFVQAF